MADLNNLLDEVDEALHENEEEREQDPRQEVVVATLDPNDHQDWDDGDREQLDVPAALEEYEQNKYKDEEDLEEDQEEEEEEDPDYVAQSYATLKRMWQQELACPELLPLDEATLQQIQEEIEEREQAIADLGQQSDDVRALLGSVLKVDTDRAKFMLGDLLRTRLWKIQEYPLHMRDLTNRMSETEVGFLKGYGQLLENHLRSTVLDHVSKDALKNLDEPEMIDRPNLEQYVFVKVKETSEINSGTEDEPFIQEHQAGTTLITRYSVVRELFGQGKVELVL